MRVQDRHIPRYDLLDMSQIEFQCLGHIIEFYLNNRRADTQDMEGTAKKLRNIIFAMRQTEPDIT